MNQINGLCYKLNFTERAGVLLFYDKIFKKKEKNSYFDDPLKNFGIVSSLMLVDYKHP